MSDLISRQAAIDAIRKDMYADKDWMSAVICDGIEDVLKRLPSAQERKTGRWIQDETDNSIECNKCGCVIWANDIMNGDAYYCPNCGAKMEVEHDS